jgi:hypothetical protein
MIDRTLPAAFMARQLELRAARGLADQARERQADLARAMDDIMRAFGTLDEIGMDKTYLAESLAGLIDAAENVDAALCKDIDSAAEYTSGVDLTEACALLAKLRGQP